MPIFKNNTSFIYKVILFLIHPFFAFVNSLRQIRERDSFWIILYFALFFSYTFIPIPYSDATRYEERFGLLGEYNLADYINDLNGMYESDSMYQDAYIYTIQLIVSPISNNIRVYRLVFGLIYFFTYLSLIKRLFLDETKKNKNFNWFILGLIFLFSFTAGINGVRWPLALMVFLFGAYSYLLTSKGKFILIASLSPFIHFIAFYLVIFLIIFVISKKFYRPKIISSLILSAFIFSSIFTSTLKSSSNSFGEGIEEKTNDYTENSRYKEKREGHLSSLNWYVIFDRYSTNYFLLGALLLTTYFGFGLDRSILTNKLQYFALLMFLASFLSGQLVDTISNRFYLSANAFGLIYLYHLYNENSKNRILRYLTYIYIPIVILHSLIILRSDLQTVSPNLFIGNLFFEFFI